MLRRGAGDGALIELHWLNVKALLVSAPNGSEVGHEKLSFSGHRFALCIQPEAG